MKYCVFAKHLQAIPLEQVVHLVKDAGFEGLDLTVRPGGYVDPTQPGFEDNVRKAVDVTRAAGLEVPLFTTAITSAHDPGAQPTLQLAKELGVPMLKLGYWPSLPGNKSLAAIDARQKLRELENFTEFSGVTLLVHNHSGDYVTCMASEVASLLIRPEKEVSKAYIDPAHFTLEGGISGWRFSLETLLHHAGMFALKDGKFIDPPAGNGPQQRRWVPVGTGNVRWGDVYSLIKASGFNGWASVHGEYQGPWSWKDLNPYEVLEQCRKDLVFLKSVEAKA